MLGSEQITDGVSYLGGDLVVAVEEPSYFDDWAAARMTADSPVVAFADHIVLRLDGTSNDDCTHFAFDGFTVFDSEAVVTLQTASTIGRTCRSFGFSHVVFVQIERDALPQAPFEFRLGEGPDSQTALVEDL